LPIDAAIYDKGKEFSGKVNCFSNQPNNFRSSNMNMHVCGEKRNDMPMEKLFQD